MEENNSLDIDLAFRAMQYLNALNPSDIPAALKPTVRPVVLNLIEFQYRFAKPMELPFMLGTDFDQVLPMPRPLELLLKYNAVVPVENVTSTGFLCL